MRQKNGFDPTYGNSERSYLHVKLTRVVQDYSEFHAKDKKKNKLSSSDLQTLVFDVITLVNNTVEEK